MIKIIASILSGCIAITLVACDAPGQKSGTIEQNQPRLFGQELIERAITNLDNGDYKKAIADFDQVIAADPELAVAYAARGSAYYYLNDKSQAKRDLQTAATLFENQGNFPRYRETQDLINDL